MNKKLCFIAIAAAVLGCLADAQETRPPIKLTPEQVKVLQAQEKQFEDSLNRANDGTKSYSALECRADAQRWTADPFDKSDERNLSINTAVMVNGQIRSMPHITAHVNFLQLSERVHEMSMCEEVDAEFQKQFNTYKVMADLYEDERSFRYFKFLMDHSLYSQFLKEDATANN